VLMLIVSPGSNFGGRAVTRRRATACYRRVTLAAVVVCFARGTGRRVVGPCFGSFPSFFPPGLGLAPKLTLPFSASTWSGSAR
jgi:hypothetical protein